MARNKTLLSLLQRLRAELRQSGNPAHHTAVRETHVQALQRVQEDLWEAHDWPHLRVRRRLLLQAGQRYYDPLTATAEPGAPASDAVISQDRLESVHVRYGEDWLPLCFGIDETHYAARDSDLDERDWPVRRWQTYADDQFEVWPVPASNADTVSLDGVLRLTGIRALRPLVADDDRCDLDDRLVTLHAAATLLSGEAAGQKLAAAQKLQRSLTANQSKVKSFGLFGSGRREPRPRRFPPTVHYRTVP